VHLKSRHHESQTRFYHIAPRWVHVPVLICMALFLSCAETKTGPDMGMRRRDTRLRNHGVMCVQSERLLQLAVASLVGASLQCRLAIEFTACGCDRCDRSFRKHPSNGIRWGVLHRVVSGLSFARRVIDGLEKLVVTCGSPGRLVCGKSGAASLRQTPRGKVCRQFAVQPMVCRQPCFEQSALCSPGFCVLHKAICTSHIRSHADYQYITISYAEHFMCRAAVLKANALKQAHLFTGQCAADGRFKPIGAFKRVRKSKPLSDAVVG